MKNMLANWLDAIRQRLINQRARDALRFALQSAVAAAATYGAVIALGFDEAFMAVVAAVFVVQPSVAGTADRAWNRIFAAALGSAIGLGLMMIAPPDWGTTLALGLAVLAVNAVAAFQADWRYGTIPAAALALGGQSDTLEIAMNRGMALGLGVAIGLAVSVILFPESARGRAARILANAVRATSDRLSRVLRRVQGEAVEENSDPRRTYHQRIDEARGAADSLRGDASRSVLAAVEAVERLHDSVQIIERAVGDEDGPPQGVSDETLERVRSTAGELMTALVEKDADFDAAYDAYEACIEAANTDVDQAGGDGPRPSAFLFGLTELAAAAKQTARTLSELPELETGLKGARALGAEALPRPR